MNLFETPKSQILLSKLLVLFLIFASCEEEDSRELWKDPIKPSEEASELSRALLITGQLIEGTFPQGTNPNEGIQITNSSSTASITKNNTLFIPFVYKHTSGNRPKGAYLEVEGADNYWEIPFEEVEEDVHVMSVGIPPHILKGEFSLNYSLYDEANIQGNTESMEVEIVGSENRCSNGVGFSRVSGNDGITVRTYDLGDQAGPVQIRFNTFTVKDRMDVRYGGKWVFSTDDQLLSDTRTAPPIKQCSEASPEDGFVSGTNSFNLDYDPAISRTLDIYMSGCLEGGTEWNFDVSCPQGGNTTPTSMICNQPSVVDRYDPNDENYHFYPGEGKEIATKICDPNTNPQCSRNFVFETMLEGTKYLAPSESNEAVTDCAISILRINIFYPRNPIATKINRTDRSITNYTLENYISEDGRNLSHFLHPGKVTRWIKEKDDGIYVLTAGEGTGAYPTFNSWFAEGLWKDVDEELKKRVEEKLNP